MRVTSLESSLASVHQRLVSDAALGPVGAWVSFGLGLDEYQTKDVFYLPTADDKGVFYSSENGKRSVLSITENDILRNSPWYRSRGANKTIFVRNEQREEVDTANLHSKTGYPEQYSWWASLWQKWTDPKRYPYTLVYVPHDHAFYVEVREGVSKPPYYKPVSLRATDIDTEKSPYYTTYGDDPSVVVRSGTLIDSTLSPEPLSMNFRVATSLSDRSNQWATWRPLVFPVSQLLTQQLNHDIEAGAGGLHNLYTGLFHLGDLPFYYYAYMPAGTYILKQIAPLFGFLNFFNFPAHAATFKYFTGLMIFGFGLLNSLHTCYKLWHEEEDRLGAYRNSLIPTTRFQDHALALDRLHYMENTLAAEKIINVIQAIAYSGLTTFSVVKDRSFFKETSGAETLIDDITSLVRGAAQQASDELMGIMRKILTEAPRPIRNALALALKTGNPNPFMRIARQTVPDLQIPSIPRRTWNLFSRNSELRNLITSLDQSSILPAFRSTVFITFLQTRMVFQEVLPAARGVYSSLAQAQYTAPNH